MGSILKPVLGWHMEDYNYPLADVSHLSDSERKDLRMRGMHMPKQLYSNEEFEQWVTVYVLHMFYETSKYDGWSEEEKQQSAMEVAALKRAGWYHAKWFEAWKKEHLQPLVDDLVEEARCCAQYSWQELYSLELKKLRCMRAYFFGLAGADRDGNFGFNRWIDACIRLLEYLEWDGSNITDEQALRMNTRNVDDIVSPDLVKLYEEAPLPGERKDEYCFDKAFYGRQIYVRKMERLYYRIRLNKMREWWD